LILNIETASNKVGGGHSKSRRGRDRAPYSYHAPSTRASSVATSTSSVYTKGKQQDTTNLYPFGRSPPRQLLLPAR
jgi:hypothetical protein